MGGYGSGKRYGARTQVEQCTALSASWLLQNRYFDFVVGQREFIDISWRNCYDETLFSLTGDIERLSICLMRLDLYTTEQVVYLGPTALHFGGTRWWFNCPGCGRRCAKLYVL